MTRRFWLALAATVSLGGLGAVAWIGVMVGLGRWPDRGGVAVFASEGESKGGEATPATPAKPPKVVVDRVHYDFGTMPPGAEAEHAFVVRNEGGSPLTLEPGPTTCKCAVSRVSPRSIPPGEQGRVVVSWNTTDRKGGFSQTAAIHTNDPLQPVLNFHIVGKVHVQLGVEPQRLVFSGLSAGQGASAEVLVFSQVWPRFRIAKTESSRAGLVCEVEPAEPSRLKEHEACSGYRLKVRLPANMPRGGFSEWLQLQVEPEDGVTPAQTCRVAVVGEVPPSVALFGRKLYPDQVLRLGSVRGGQGTKERLMLLIREEPRQIAIQRIETRPEFLRVQVVPLTTDPSQSGLYRIDVEVPPDAPPGNFIGERHGEIAIQTDHPQIPRVRLKVELAVSSH